MALQPGPGTVVVVVPEGVTQLDTLAALRTAPIRPGVEGDFIVGLDAAGAPFRSPWAALPVEPTVPDNAFVDEAGNYFTDEFGAYFTA